MDQSSANDRLSRISTSWSVVQEAHGSAADEATEARHRLIRRYGGAVYRYLLGALRDQDAADDLAQEFALRFVRGDLRRADPRRGRFRDFVKTVLFHLVVDHHQLRRNRPLSLPSDGVEPVAPDAGSDQADREFLQCWRDDLLARAWEALAWSERETGQPYYTILRLRAEHPEIRSPELAARLGALRGKPITAEGVRQTLHRARERFADLLLDEVAQSLDRPNRDDLERELIDLELLSYCRPSIARRGADRC